MGGATIYWQIGGLRQDLINLDAAIEALEALAKQRLADHGIKRKNRAKPVVGVPQSRPAGEIHLQHVRASDLCIASAELHRSVRVGRDAQRISVVHTDVRVR